MFTSSLGWSLSHCKCLRHYQNVNKKMILTFPGNLFSTSECTSNTQFTLYQHGLICTSLDKLSHCHVTWIFEQTWGLHPHSSPAPRKALHIIKGLVKIALCHVSGLISWGSGDESRGTPPTPGNLPCVGGHGWPRLLSMLTVIGRKPSRCSAPGPAKHGEHEPQIEMPSNAASLWCHARQETSATGMQAWKSNAINHKGAAASANQIERGFPFN